jgi:hypothetical protein
MKVAGIRIGSDGVVAAFASVVAPGGGAVPWTFAGLVGAVWGAAVAAGGAVETLDTGLTVPESSLPHPETARPRTVAVRAAWLVRNVRFSHRPADNEGIT